MSVSQADAIALRKDSKRRILLAWRENPHLSYTKIAQLTMEDAKTVRATIRTHIDHMEERAAIRDERGLPALEERKMMTGDDFAECLIVLGWTKRWLANHLNVHHSVINRMALGQSEIPHGLQVWLKKRATFAKLNEFPRGMELLT